MRADDVSGVTDTPGEWRGVLGTIRPTEAPEVPGADQPVNVMGVPDLAAFLCGRWHLNRTIVDIGGDGAADLGHASIGHFAGTAAVWPDPEAAETLHYLEEGTLHLANDARRPAYRRLRYLITGARARVEFDGGRYFHDLDLSSGRWRVEYPCGADLYLGRFAVASPDRWWQEWTVHGPTKSYALHTRLDRRTS